MVGSSCSTGWGVMWVCPHPCKCHHREIWGFVTVVRKYPYRYSPGVNTRSNSVTSQKAWPEFFNDFNWKCFKKRACNCSYRHSECKHPVMFESIFFILVSFRSLYPDTSECISGSLMLGGHVLPPEGVRRNGNAVSNGFHELVASWLWAWVTRRQAWSSLNLYLQTDGSSQRPGSFQTPIIRKSEREREKVSLWPFESVLLLFWLPPQWSSMFPICFLGCLIFKILLWNHI